MALILVLVSIISLLIGAILCSEASEYKKQIALLGLICVISFGVPFIKNNEYTIIHKSMLTNQYDDITFNEVMQVEWDEHKGCPFWTWRWVSMDTKYNVTARRADDGTMR